MRTHMLGDAGEHWVADRLRSLGYDVEFLPRNAKAVDLVVTGQTVFRVQVKCSDHQHIKFPSLKALDGLADDDFVIALMPSATTRVMTLEDDEMWTFVIPAQIARQAARHVHESYRADYVSRRGVEPAGSFGPTVKFYKNTAWHNQARLWLWPFRDAWSGLPLALR
jgi:hypothetical protein